MTHECDFPEAARALPAITFSVFDHEGKSCADIETAHIGEDLMSNGTPSWFAKAGVVAVDGSSYFNRPGPRIVDGVELLASLFRGDMIDGRSTKARWVRPNPALAQCAKRRRPREFADNVTNGADEVEART